MSLKEQLDLALEQLGLPRDIVGRKFVMKHRADSLVLTMGTLTSVYAGEWSGSSARIYAKFCIRTPLAPYADETEHLQLVRDDMGARWEYRLCNRSRGSERYDAEVEIL